MPKQKKNADHPDFFVPPVEEKAWRTEGLFSDFFLKKHLKEDDSWPKDDDLKDQFELIRDLYKKVKGYLGGKNEALTRQDLIHPVLEKLGFARIDNQSLPEESSEPDAILYYSQAERDAVLRKSKDAQYRASIAILEAKSFRHPLSQISKSQQRYPHQQIRDYLQGAQVVNWGILTNGEKWRLYCKETKPKDFFEIDLETALNSKDSFKAFWVLFSHDAFQRDAQGKCRLDRIRAQALSSQSQLENDIRKRVFDILLDLANGFRAQEQNEIADAEVDFRSLYKNCLIYLYRLLFVLYAEGRNLLPVKSETRRYYKSLSLARLQGALRDFTQYEDIHNTALSNAIRNLFRLINGGNKRMNDDYGVPRYNGGLFDPKAHSELEKWEIGDRDMAQVLRGLMFNPPPDRLNPNIPYETVDFSDLRVQHLGSIYEGLLEHHLAVTENDNLELKTDKAERKATGTYYTPDYIVKYIVEQSIKPLLDEIDKSEPVLKARDAKRQDNSFADAVLQLHICDPAMGSGHFLVEATILLADQIAFHPTTKRSSEKAKDEEEIAYWRRRVVECCIFGVDLNPLAVELAKLSLWLTCISSNKPLNFLDHHLRVGNSLIGARLNQLGELPNIKGKLPLMNQADLFFQADLQKAVAATISGIQIIERESSESVEAVKGKEQRWADEILPMLAPFKHIADLWTGAFFGEMSDKQAYIETLQKILKKPKKEYSTHNRKFLHWELEFPEVFFNEDGTPNENPGFDAVVGNPPYLQKESFEHEEKLFILGCYPENASNVNLATVFMSRAKRLTRMRGYNSYIVPKSLLFTKAWEGDRKRLLLGLERLCDVSKAWKEVLLEQCIYVWAKGSISSPGFFVDICNEENIISGELIEKKFCERLGIIPVEFNLKIRKILDQCLELGENAKKYAKFACGLPYQNKLRDEGNIPAIGGDQIDRYETLDLKGYFCLDDLERDLEFIGRVKNPHIVLQRIVAHILYPQDHIRIAGTINASGLIPVNTITCVFPKENSNLSLSFLCSWLNSRFYSWYAYNFVFSKAIRSMDLYEYFASKVPIRRVNFTTPAEKRSSLHKTAQHLYKRAIETSETGTVLGWTAEQLKAQPERTDVVHDFLAFLAERMMALKKEKREAQQQFFRDLKDFHRIDAQNLKPKTRLDEFWKLETSEVFTHFDKNRKTLHAAGATLYDDAKKEVRSSFEKARSAILPLVAQIEFTDRLIDQIVYKLYGLTEEEIAIVEGTGKT